jgi:hypothetical protein
MKRKRVTINKIKICGHLLNLRYLRANTLLRQPLVADTPCRFCGGRCYILLIHHPLAVDDLDFVDKSTAEICGRSKLLWFALNHRNF